MKSREDDDGTAMGTVQAEPSNPVGERLQSTVDEFVNRAVRTGALIMGAVTLALTVAVAVSGLRAVGVTGLLWAALPAAGAVLVFWAAWLARRGRLRGAYTYILGGVLGALPVAVVAVTLPFDRYAAATFVQSPGQWWWLLILCSFGLSFDRKLASILGCWFGSQFLLMFLLASSALGELQGPPALVEVASGWDSAGVRAAMLVGAGILIGQVGHLMRRVVLALLKEEDLRKEQVVARARAEEATRMKSALLAHLGHEVRTPLNAVVGFAASLPDTEGAARQIQTLRRGAAHVDLLVDNILRGVSGQASRPLRLQSFHLGQHVETTAELMRPEASSRGLDISVHIERDAPTTVTSDPAKLRQILMNVVGNALKYTEQGEVALRVARAGGGRFQVDVRDTGPGIDAADLESIFEPYERVGGAEDTPGAGLGLAICRTLTAELGGTLDVHSTVGVGSLFTLLAPANPAPQTPPKRATLPVVVPKPDSLAELRRWANEGNLGRVAEVAAELSGGDETLQPFSDAVAALVDEVDDDGLEAFLEGCEAGLPQAGENR